MQRLRLNNQIRAAEIQVIDADGKPLGVMPTSKGIQLAHEKGLDLVEVGPNAQPPIAKIMDYGKYVYQKERQEKARPKPKEVETKTIRIGYKTGIHDMKVRQEKIDEFLGEGHVVKVELTLRGREKALAHLGKEKLINFLKTLTIPHTVQQNPQRGPYGWVVMIQRDKKQNPHENKKGSGQTSKNNVHQQDSKAPAAPESL